jgi:hypothetical protein
MQVSVGSIAAAAGAADTALFIVRRPGLFRSKPRRAFMNLGLLAAWSTLLTRTAAETSRHTASTTVLAATVTAANGAMLAAHLAHRVATPRVFVGPLASSLVLADTLRRR